MTKKLFLKILAALALATPAAFADHHEKISVLIVDGQNNHNWKATTPCWSMP